MGVFKGAHITEQRVYADPSNPETSDFEVALLVTVPEAVTDTETGKNLRDILTEQTSEINVAKKTAESAKNAADEINSQITEGGGVPASTLGGKTADEFAAAAHTHSATDISDLPTTLPANGGNAETVNGHTVLSNVPANAKFTDTVYSLPAASASVRGGVKVGYTANGKNYPVQLSNEQMFVNVPWTDTNTTYSAATASSSGLVSTGSQTFGGAKTFNGSVYPNGASACGTAQARKLSSGTAAATTSNCAAGCWYGQYE